MDGGGGGGGVRALLLSFVYDIQTIGHFKIKYSVSLYF